MSNRQPRRRISDSTCECADPGCPCCKGKCQKKAQKRLYRVDMEDETGTAMCKGCAADAMESGLFRDEK